MMFEQEKGSLPVAWSPRDGFCRKKVLQEVIVHPDGGIEIPWITPAAAPLLREIWKTVNSGDVFPVTAGEGSSIYCG
jgi:hypothetical protein